MHIFLNDDESTSTWTIYGKSIIYFILSHNIKVWMTLNLLKLLLEVVYF